MRCGGVRRGDDIVIAANRSAKKRNWNWMFIGHPEAGERSAVIYTLLGGCWRHGLNPFDYLKELFTRLPAARITQIKEFTPAAWTKAKEQVFAQAA